ncbi:MAG: hypothetical protein QME64_06730 [bacterium]|nr:hypothetical protein [bacterium]
MRKRSNGRILVYELSVNLNTAEWDIGIPSKNRQLIHQMLQQNQTAANARLLGNRNPVPVKPELNLDENEPMEQNNFAEIPEEAIFAEVN